jgi:Na+/H+ antiporter NhaB
MRLLQNIIALAVFFCIAAALIYVGVYILLAVLIVMGVAFAWYGVKFYFLRKEIARTIHEHQQTHFSDAFSPRGNKPSEPDGPVIEGEFEEVDSERKKKG